jgi:hypothetical protein
VHFFDAEKFLIHCLPRFKNEAASVAAHPKHECPPPQATPMFGSDAEDE